MTIFIKKTTAITASMGIHWSPGTRLLKRTGWLDLYHKSTITNQTRSKTHYQYTLQQRVLHAINPNQQKYFIQSGKAVKPSYIHHLLQYFNTSVCNNVIEISATLISIQITIQNCFDEQKFFSCSIDSAQIHWLFW